MPPEDAEVKPGAEGAAEGKQEGTEEKKGPSPLVKKLILAGIIIAILAVEGVVAFLLVKATKQEDPRMLAEKQAREQESMARKRMTSMGVTTDPIDVIVNIAGVGEEEERFAKVAVQLEFDDIQHPELMALIDLRKPKIKNILIEELTKRKIDELISPAGKIRLRSDIKREVNKTIPKDKGEISGVYLSEFVIQ